MDWFCYSVWDALEKTKLNRPNAGEVRVLIPGLWALGELPKVFSVLLLGAWPLSPQPPPSWNLRGLGFGTWGGDFFSERGKPGSEGRVKGGGAGGSVYETLGEQETGGGTAMDETQTKTDKKQTWVQRNKHKQRLTHVERQRAGGFR